MGVIYDMVYTFKKKHPSTVAWRLKKNSKVVEGYINTDEKVRYAFAAQYNEHWYDIFSTAVVALTSKRLLIGRKRVIIGSSYSYVTPDMFNDMLIYRGIFWGRIEIDTIKEHIVFTNVAKSALDEIETAISTFMMEEKKKYHAREDKPE